MFSASNDHAVKIGGLVFRFLSKIDHDFSRGLSYAASSVSDRRVIRIWAIRTEGGRRSRRAGSLDWMLLTAFMVISVARTKHAGEMICRRMASATRAVRRVTPSLNMALVRRFATVAGEFPSR